MKKILITTITLVFLAAFAPEIIAQTGELNIVRPVDGSQVIPISMSGFSGTAQEVLKFDLEVHGFEFVAADTASFIVTGKNNGQVEGRLTDKNKTTMLSRAYTGGNTRSQAHALANDIILAI